MTPWACGIVGCDRDFETAEGLIRHQAADHPSHECKVCGRTVPAGYLAIRHAFEEHTRAEYVRTYNADSDDIRLRERIVESIEDGIDVSELVSGLETDGDPLATTGD